DQGVQVKKEPSAFYPVFVRGRDVAVAAQPSAACSTTGPTRITESAEIEFGRPGSEFVIDNGAPPAPADGVADPSELVLVGFVQWDGILQLFKRAVLVANGTGPRFAGSLADEVVARNGLLTLRSRRQVDKPALAIDEAGDGALVFGPQDPKGRVVPAFKVDTKGNVTAQGTISGHATAGTVQVQSGVITDGVVLPLPPGVKPEDVTAGKILLHVHLTPRVPGSLPPDFKGSWMALPLECRLDGPSRRVRCSVRWFTAANPASFQDQPSACDYTVMATVLATVLPKVEGQP